MEGEGTEVGFREDCADSWGGGSFIKVRRAQVGTESENRLGAVVEKTSIRRGHEMDGDLFGSGDCRWVLKDRVGLDAVVEEDSEGERKT